jgi:hypothetical protein
MGKIGVDLKEVKLFHDVTKLKEFVPNSQAK